MVTFLSLFLGLVTGVQTIHLAVSPEVARVEVLLDGVQLGVLESEPWTLRCDVGEVLAPRELVAVAYDAEGNEMGRDQQWLNLPQRLADAKIVPSFGYGGEVLGARIIWESPSYSKPTAVAAKLDGGPVEVAADGSIDLSGCDLATIHLLNVTLRFAANVVVERELVFGGGRTAVTGADLTAVVLQLHKGKELPPVGAMEGWLVHDGDPLEVRAIETGPATVVVVRDLNTGAALKRRFEMWYRSLSVTSGGGRLRGTKAKAFDVASVANLQPGDVMQLIEPVPVRADDRVRPTRLFPRRVQQVEGDNGLFQFLIHDSRIPSKPRQLVDAVAVAGAAAVREDRRRAVVVLLGKEPEDSSRRSIREVCEYLGSLQVPLQVWNMSGRSTRKVMREWGEVSKLSSFDDFGKNVKQLNRMLERQRIVWVVGSHAPHEIALGPSAQGVSLAGTTCCGGCE